MYIGWAVNVNKIILDSTSVKVGDKATIQDSLESGGQKKSRLVCANPPDSFNVTMSFSFSEESKDSNGYTEIERFWIWYKYQHCYGANPFIFPAILINSNRQQGDSLEHRQYIANQLNNQQHPQVPFTPDTVMDSEYYCITSAVEGSKSGTEMQISMTWETYATGSYTIPDEESAIDHIISTNGYVDVILTSTPISEPTVNTWDVMITNPLSVESQETIIACFFDGNVTARLYFNEKTVSGTYTVRIGEFTSTFIA